MLLLQVNRLLETSKSKAKANAMGIGQNDRHLKGQSVRAVNVIYQQKQSAEGASPIIRVGPSDL